MKDWTAEQVQGIGTLTGRVVTSYVVVEMAFRLDFPPQFSDPTLPFIQGQILYLLLDPGEVVAFATYQCDDGFGLCLHLGVPEADVRREHYGAVASDGDASIFRTRALEAYPTGEITQANAVVDDDGVITEVNLTVGCEPILLLAGEVDELTDGAFRVTLRGEGILMFRYPALRLSVRFR